MSPEHPVFLDIHEVAPKTFDHKVNEMTALQNVHFSIPE